MANLRCLKCDEVATYVVNAIEVPTEHHPRTEWAWLACRLHATRAVDVDLDEVHTLFEWSLALELGIDPEDLSSSASKETGLTFGEALQAMATLLDRQA